MTAPRNAPQPIRNRAAQLAAALRAILAEPYGCPFCDSGRLRAPDNPEKGHDEACGYRLAAAALAPSAEDELQFVERLKVLDLLPEDVLVLEHPRVISAAGKQALEQQVERLFPKHRCIVLEEGLTLKVAARAEV